VDATPSGSRTIRTAEPMIRLDRVSKRYADGTTAVAELSLDVPDGEICVLVGPSGCGKTTTMKMINRLIEPSGGRIFLAGEDVTGADPVKLRRRIGYVIQQVGLFPHLTIEANVATVPALLGWDKRETRQRVTDLLELVGLDPKVHGPRYPHQLSGGQRQRVGVARALAADPPVLLMDEPFSAVDPIVRASLQDELLRLQAELRKTVVFVTHDIEEAIKVGDQVAIFRPGGHLAQVDPPERLLAAPADSYVEDFIGFDRGIRRLSFLAAGTLDLDTGAVVGQDVPAVEALATARAADAPWLLVVDAERRPHGWVAAGQLQAAQDHVTLADVPVTGYGHTFRADSDSLRAALDATVLSATGQAIGVDADGRVIGVTTYDRLRAAIQRADAQPAPESVPAP
jgi:osmoprotectant transport system ATP-binding protein